MTDADTVVPPRAVTRWMKLSDRLNPIVVREVRQALKGKAFLVTILVALVLVVVVATVIIRNSAHSDSFGSDMFDAGLTLLVPLLVFIIPLGAFQSTRTELGAGMVEQLLLTELSPRRIVTGKLVAAMVQFVLYVSILSPLLATSYLLRGVDLPMIGVSLLFALLVCITATAIAVAAAAQVVQQILRGVANLGLTVGLAVSTTILMSYIGSGEYAREVGWLAGNGFLGSLVSLVVLSGLASCVLAGLAAASSLAHAHENRSTSFRVYLFLLGLAAFGWVAVAAPVASRAEAFSFATVVLLLLAALFSVFMVTECRALSPRQRVHVPRRPVLALLVAPWLPGRDRGLLCYVLFLCLLAGMLAGAWGAFGLSVSGFSRDTLRLIGFLVSYSILYDSIARFVRARLPENAVGSRVSRAVIPLLLILCSILPLLLQLMVFGRASSDWSLLHVMNPFWTIDEFAFRSRGDSLLTEMLAVAGGLLLLQVRGMYRGVREVVLASRRLRQGERGHEG